VPDGQHAQDAATAVRTAVAAGDWVAVRLLLHPYLHWTDQRGATVRGRRAVLAVLQQTGPPDLPAAVELRDGQIYRWRS